jgi:hypothetical protein
MTCVGKALTLGIGSLFAALGITLIVVSVVLFHNSEIPCLVETMIGTSITGDESGCSVYGTVTVGLQNNQSVTIEHLVCNYKFKCPTIVADGCEGGYFQIGKNAYCYMSLGKLMVQRSRGDLSAGLVFLIVMGSVLIATGIAVSTTLWCINYRGRRAHGVAEHEVLIN